MKYGENEKNKTEYEFITFYSYTYKLHIDHNVNRILEIMKLLL